MSQPIKVVQIAIAASLDDTWTQMCLDDKGRIWEYQWSMNKLVWTQIELPQEPEVKE